MLHESVSITVDLNAARIGVTAAPAVRPAALAWARANRAGLLALARAKGGNGRVRLSSDDLAALATPLLAPVMAAEPPPEPPPRVHRRQADAWRAAVCDALIEPLRHSGFSTLIDDASASAVRCEDWRVIAEVRRDDYPRAAEAARALLAALEEA